MKSTLIAVCVFTAVHPGFAEDKCTPSPRGREVFKTHNDAKPNAAPVHVAKPAVVVKAPPPNRPWVGRTVIISPSERDAIRAYVRNRLQESKGGKFNGVPQGLAKKVAWPNNLPDGWQKSCNRGRVLPGDVHKHCQPLPEELTLKLPAPPPGTVLLAVDGTVVRVGYPTYEILDLFDVLSPPAELMGPQRPRSDAQRLAAVTPRASQ